MGKRKNQRKAFGKKYVKDIKTEIGKKRNAESAFEMKSNKKAKQRVFGRYQSGQRRNVIRARSDAVESRKKSLLVEYRRNRKANTFIDRRLGEGNEALDDEDKMLLRMQRQRERQFRKNRYNLDAGDPDVELTHYGQSLSANNFEDDDMFGNNDGDESDDSQMNAELVDKTHFGGGFRLKKKRNVDEDRENETERDDKPKTRREIMQEIIAKSKIRKAERRKEKEERDDEREELDAELEGIKDLLDFGGAAKGNNAGAKRTKTRGREDIDEYDKMTRELAHDHRAQATDRLRTPAEIARAEHARLRHLEEQRLLRMRGDDDDDEEEEEEEEKSTNDTGDQATASSKIGLREKRRAEQRRELRENERRIRAAGGDDLGANFVVDPEFALRNSDSDDDDDDDASENEQDVPAKTPDSSSALPFTFDNCPSDRMSLEAMLRAWSAFPIGGKDDNDRAARAGTLLDRVRASNSALVDEANVTQMRAFLLAIVETLARYAVDQGASCAPFVDALTKAAWSTARDVAGEAETVFRDKLRIVHNRFVGGTVEMPDIPTLIDFRLIGCIFACSDFRHPIATPSTLLLGQTLVQAPARSGIDILSALCVVETLIQYTHESKRFVPEAVSFVVALLARVALCLHSSTQSSDADSSTDLAAVRSALLGAPACCPTDAVLLLRSTSSSVATDATMRLSAFELLCAECQATESDDTSLLPPAALRLAVRLLKRLATAHASQSYFASAFSTSIAVLRVLTRTQRKEETQSKTLRLPEGVIVEITDVLRYLETTKDTSENAREDLNMKIRRPVAIRQMMPRFDEDFDPSRSLDPDRARVALKQMKRTVRRERKSTARELRRDNAFLAREREKEIEKRDARLEARQREVMHFLQEQQRTFKEMVKKGHVHGGGSGGGGQKTKRRQFG